VGRLDPAIADADRTVEHLADAEALESLDPSDNVDERIHGAYLVQRHLSRGHAVDRAFSLAQELERANGSLAHPLGDRRVLDLGDQIADVPVRTVALRAAGTMGVLVIGEIAVTVVGVCDGGTGVLRQDRLRRWLG
jgi:hypothetical protein